VKGGVRESDYTTAESRLWASLVIRSAKVERIASCVRSKQTKMNVVSVLIDNKRSVSKNWLLGLTVGAYSTLSIALYFFGGGRWVSSSFEPIDFPPGELQAFGLMIPGLFVGLLDYAQIHSEVFFKRKANERLTAVSVWLNAAAILSFLALIPLNSMPWTAVIYLRIITLLSAAICFSLGNLIGVLHVLWMVTAGKGGKGSQGLPQAGRH
jgi:hypothetical protein